MECFIGNLHLAASLIYLSYPKKRNTDDRENWYHLWYFNEHSVSSTDFYISSLFEIIQSLYWAIYGLVDLEHSELEEPHEFTEFIGKLMFGSYSWIAFVVLLNLLIAMMSNSYQNISVSICNMSKWVYWCVGPV